MKHPLRKTFLKFRPTKKIYIKVSLLKNKYYLHKRKKLLFKSLKCHKNCVFVIGSPTHTNIGDSAITIAQIDFLGKCGFNSDGIKEISLSEYNMYRDYLVKKICKKGNLITLLGGGNMGNQWMNEEVSRRNMVLDFYKNTVIIFPQTIFYTHDVQGQKEQDNSIAIYNKNNLVIVAREKVSYDMMKKLYPKAKILLTPDIVLSVNPTIFKINNHVRDGVLFIFRMDSERSMEDTLRLQLIAEIKKINMKYTISDMHSKEDINKENRARIVSDKMNEFASAKLVITDRLHGMIFAAITGTPCIVFSNYNHKVKGTYDWISYLSYIKYANTIEEAKKFIPILLKSKNCKYDNLLTSIYEELKEIIISNAEN